MTDMAEEAQIRYQAMMNQKPINEKEMLQAHSIGLLLQTNPDLKPDEIRALVYEKARLENTVRIMPPGY